MALVRGLQLTTVLHVNIINAGQVALAALAGVIFFGESCNAWLVLGISLMVAGILAFGSPVDEEAIDAHV
jgi:drug/metabolite transporter (DMT)-like permease